MDKLNNINLLFLEDNEAFAQNTVKFLNMYFENIFHSTNIKDALIYFEDNRIDAIISDINVKDGNGLDFIVEVRKKNSDIPIIVLSAHKDEDFLFKAIPLNITSYELKPLSYNNFVSLLKKLLAKLQSKDIFHISDELIYIYKSKELSLNGNSIKLNKKEFLLIELLIKSAGDIVTCDMIQSYVWESNIMSSSAVKNLVFRLRKKVDIDFIFTVQSVGYKINSKSNT